MKTILITGLDGSGKSTILNKIKTLEEFERVEVINLPELRRDNIRKNSILHQTATFINALNQQADAQKTPAIKAIALMVSMLLYKELEQNAQLKGIKFLISERHPLIDTGIYAPFYAKKMGEGSIDAATIKQLDEKYQNELAFLNEIAPRFLQSQYNLKSIDGIRQLIYNKFGEELEQSENKIAAIFELDFPAEIYFLKASPNILFNRITNRKHTEAHEKLEVLEKMNQFYIKKFEQLQNAKKSKIKYINAESFEELNNFTAKITKTVT